MTSTWPILTRQDVIAFEFSSWFFTFSSLSIKSTVIPLPDQFRSYLEADGVFVPTGSENSYVCPLVDTLTLDTSNDCFRPPKSTLTDDNADDCHSDSEDEATTSAATQYAFPEIDAQIQAAIDAYGGGVFPKLNFSSPKAHFPLFCSSWGVLIPPSFETCLGCGLAVASVAAAAMHVSGGRVHAIEIVRLCLARS